jgi:hypothetical protein
MTDTSGNPANWRDIADQLTPHQIAHMETLERHIADHPDGLLYFARRYAAENLRHSVMFGHIKPPPDAAHCFGWQQAGDDDARWFREFWGEQIQPGDVGLLLGLTGRQFSDGRCERTGVMVAGKHINQLTAAQARELARLLVEAAVEIEQGDD